MLTARSGDAPARGATTMREKWQVNKRWPEDARLPSAPAAPIDERLREARPRLLRIAQSFALPLDIAEDIAQETSLRAWRNLASLRDTTQFDAWLNTICRNQCRMYLRTARRTPTELRLPTADADDATDPASGAEWADPQALDPLDVVSREDAALLLDLALGYLAPRDRTTLEMRYIERLPLAEAADALGVTPHVLEARINRARVRLRAALAGPLRSAAEDFGLAVSRDDRWRPTRLGCYHCGRRMLLGRFEVAVNGRIELRLRCPECSKPESGDIFRSKGIAPLDGPSAFQPALARSLRALAERTHQALASGRDVCLHCGRPTQRRVAAAEEYPTDLTQGQARRWAVAPCARPGCPGLGAWPALHVMLGGEPAAQRFINDHPRWVTTPENVIEWQGRSAIRFHLRDTTSAAQLTVLADQTSLLTLATY
ncbi:MAG TPA: sigma-70 family RNA polymerase sigma factor [Ktedonobacterales bacterium]|nr:sigma-70 family RNA polymerase sigma factor [Ktedonobacterales bacterium]